MEIQRGIAVQVSVKVLYDGPEAYHVRLTASTPYDDGARSAAIGLELDASELEESLQSRITEVCQALIDTYGNRAALQAISAASEAQRVAMQRGEI